MRRSRWKNARALSAEGWSARRISGNSGAAVSGPPPVAGRLCLYECNDVVARELVASLERHQLDEEREGDDLSLELSHELDRSRDGPACGQQVIDDQHLRTGLDRVPVHLQGGRPVLEVVLDAHHVGRQLTELPDGYEADAELVRDRCAEDEAARLHADDDV